MNYLGEQIDALNTYSKEAVCWLSIKLKGRYNLKRNREGYNCGVSLCYYCNSTNKRSGLDDNFYELFSTEDIKEIIRSKPNRLMEIWDEKSRIYINLYGKTLDNFKDQCEKLFVDSGYTNWFLLEKKNYLLANLLDHHTCLYCNREYIFVYRKSEGKGMVPQFDHWFPKKDFPLFGLSFYNLIPSCGTCNSIKSSENLNLVEHLHPYIDINISSSYLFSFLALDTNKNQIVFKNNSFFNTKGIDTVNALNLELIYRGHSDKELQDLIDLRHKYSINYLNILLEKMFPDLDISKEERYRLIFGIELNSENYHKRIFSKFKNDIVNELTSIR